MGWPKWLRRRREAPPGEPTLEPTQPLLPPVECRDCGRPRDRTAEFDATSDTWSQCPDCGGSVGLIRLGFHEVNATPSDHFTATSTMGGVERTAARRWAEAAATVDRLRQPYRVHLDGEAVARYQADLYGAFIDIMTLRQFAAEQLDEQAQAPTPSVWAMLEADRWMCIAHDLGNLAKHPGLGARQVKSGGPPSFGQPNQTTTSASPDFTFDIVITHGSDQHSALHVAAKALDGWKAVLTSWGLLT